MGTRGVAARAALRSRLGDSGCVYVLFTIPIGPSTKSSMILAKGWPTASESASCMTVTPPPEYFMAVRGGRSMKTLPTLEGSSPFRICTVVGSGSAGS